MVMPLRATPETAPRPETGLTRPDGLVIPIPTPLNGSVASFEVDKDFLPGLINPVIDNGASAIFCLGKAGFFDYLHFSHKFNMVHQTINAVNNRVPVLVGVTDTNPDISVALAQYAERQGAAGLVLIPYFQHHDWGKAGAITQMVLNATKNISVVIYNNDGLQLGQSIPPAWLNTWKLHPRITGMKHSVSLNKNPSLFEQMAALQDENFHVAVGDSASIIPAITMASNSEVGNYLVPGCVPIQATIPELAPVFADIFKPGWNLAAQ